jgi:hypothetical protein
VLSDIENTMLRTQFEWTKRKQILIFFLWFERKIKFSVLEIFIWNEWEKKTIVWTGCKSILLRWESPLYFLYKKNLFLFLFSFISRRQSCNVLNEWFEFSCVSITAGLSGKNHLKLMKTSRRRGVEMTLWNCNVIPHH